jgi:dihydroxy-acid dehydratase
MRASRDGRPEEIASQIAGRKVNTGVRHGDVLEKYALTVRPSHQGAVTHPGAVSWLRDES